VATTDKIHFTYQPIYEDGAKTGRKLDVEWSFDSKENKYLKSKSYTWTDTSNIAIGWTQTADQIAPQDGTTPSWPNNAFPFVRGEEIEDNLGAYTEYHYEYTIDGSGETEGSYKIPDLDLHLQWNKLCTVTFCKSLNDMAIVLYGDENLTLNSIKAITGPQELYSCEINTANNYFKPIEADYYKGVFSNDGIIT
jgi:hypothetical protein